MAIGKNIKGITIEFNGDTTKLGRALKDVESKASGLDRNLKGVDRALKFNPHNVELLSQKQQLLGQKVTQTKEKLEALRAAQAKLDDDPAVDKQSQEYQELRREIIETESKLKHFEDEAKKLNNVKLTALGGQMKDVGDKMKTAGKTMSTYVTAPLVGAGTVAVKKFAEVDKTMQLTNATMQNSEADARLLSDAMKEAAANSTYGMNDAATASLNFARAGLTAKEAADTLAPAMNLAAGEGGNLDVVSAGLVATINGFGDEFSNASRYADVFANACNNSALDVDSLSEAMSVAAPIFSAAGYRVEDAALYMGIMANNGIEASEAANSLKTGMARLITPSKQGAEWMDQLGFSITNADGTMKDSVQVQKELHDSFGTLSESEQIAAASAIFGKNQMSKWLALINASPDDVEALNTKLQENGTTTDMANKMMSGFGGSLEKLKSGVDVAATSLGEALAPIISKVADLIQWLVDKFNGLSPSAQRVVAVVMAIVAAIGPLLVIGGVLISSIGSLLIYLPMITGALTNVLGIVPKLVGGIKTIGTAVGGLTKLLMANPWMLVAAAAIAAIILIIKNWDTIKEFFSKLWEGIKAVATQAWESFKAMILGVWYAIKLTASTIWNGIKTVFATVFKAIQTIISTYINIWKTIFRTAFNVIKNYIITPIRNAWTWLRTTFDNIKAMFRTKFDNLRQIASDKFRAIKDAILAPIRKARDLIKGIIDKIKGFFDFKFKIPHIKLPHISISPRGWRFSDLFDGSIPSLNIDWYAKGGIFRSPSVIGVGEKGPEAVLPIEKLQEMLAGMADNIVNGMAMNMMLHSSGGNGEVTIVNYLYPSGPKMGETTVKMYDEYKRIMG